MQKSMATMESSELIMLDTNVWLDYFIASRPGHPASFELIEKAFETKAALAHAAISTKDLYFIVAARIKSDIRAEKGGGITEKDAAIARETAWACLNTLNSFSTPVGCDQTDIWLAEKQRGIHDDFEDDLIIAAAMRCNAKLLVTNDEKLLRHCPVAALSVADAIRYFSQNNHSPQVNGV